MFGYGLGRIINVVLIIGTATAIGILQPAFSEGTGFTQIVVSLFNFQWTQEFLMKWLLVLAFLAACYTLFTSIIFRNIPITIISTKIDAMVLRLKFTENSYFAQISQTSRHTSVLMSRQAREPCPATVSQYQLLVTIPSLLKSSSCSFSREGEPKFSTYSAMASHISGICHYIGAELGTRASSQVSAKQCSVKNK